jgi:hypothetical protein
MFKICLAEDKLVILYLLKWLRNKQFRHKNFRGNKKVHGVLWHRPKQQEDNVFSCLQSGIHGGAYNFKRNFCNNHLGKILQRLECNFKICLIRRGREE